MRPQRHLLIRFFAGNVKHITPVRQRHQGLQQQGGFSNAWIAADKNNGAIDQPAAQNAVELADTSGLARYIAGFNF